MKGTIDMHCHMIGDKKPNEISKEQIMHLKKNYLSSFAGFCLSSGRRLRIDLEKLYVSKLVKLVRESEYVDKAVLLAMDKPYDGGKAHLYVDNDYVKEQVKKFPNELLFGASINPARPKAIEALKRYKDDGSVLNKILQNSMRVDL